MNLNTLTTLANAQAQGEGGFLSSLLGMAPMIIIIVVMFYLMYRSQKKEQKKRQDMITAIKKDDDVMTIGGIRGKITAVKEENFKLEIAPNVEIEIAKSAVAHVISPEVADDKKAAEGDKK